MNPPILITPPIDPVLTLPEVKAQCRVEHDVDDVYLVELERAAVAHLDGWKGTLGRCIMSQTWRQEFACWGEYLLAFPDITSVSVTYWDGADWVSVGVEYDLTLTAMGYRISVSGPDADRVRVDYTCALPSEQIGAIKQAVRLLVSHWYEHRSAAMTSPPQAVAFSVDALVGALRWRRL